MLGGERTRAWTESGEKAMMANGRPIWDSIPFQEMMGKVPLMGMVTMVRNTWREWQVGGVLSVSLSLSYHYHYPDGKVGAQCYHNFYHNLIIIIILMASVIIIL